MGRSAKLHKRVQKKATAPSSTQPQHAIPESKPKPKQGGDASSSVQSAKKRADLKSKTKGKSSKSVTGEHVLGGADYVTLLLGGRRKAAQEALKLPVEE